MNSANLAEVYTKYLATIGHPMYQAANDESYFQKNTFWNPWLSNRFSDLYTELCRIASYLTGKRSGFSARLAVPGFHLISSFRDDQYQGGGWHEDVFYSSLVPRECDYSLTLPLHALSTDGIIYRGSDMTEQFFPHRDDCFTVIPKGISHMIAPVEVREESRVRLSFQSHVTVTGTMATVFW